MRFLRPLLILLVLGGCATIAGLEYDKRFGPADPTRFDTPRPPHGDLSFRADVEPILDRRCVVCHGCYDAPCQLKLGAWDGIARGATKGPSTTADAPAGGAADAPVRRCAATSQWRQKGFFPVLNERTPRRKTTWPRACSTEACALEARHPLASANAVVGRFDFSLDRARRRARAWTRYDGLRSGRIRWPACPTACRASNEREHGMLTRWLAAGSPDERPAAAPAGRERQVQDWERFLNGDSLKEQLMSRYLYEHLFLGAPLFRRRPAATVLPPRALDARRRVSRSTRSPRAARTTIRAWRASYYRLRAGARDHRSPRRTCPTLLIAATHATAPRLVPRRPPMRVDALPGYAAERGLQSLRHLRRASRSDSRYRFLLDEAAVLHHELHQGSGLPRPGRARRDRGPLLGRSSSTRTCGARCDERRVAGPRGDQRCDLPAERRQRRASA